MQPRQYNYRLFMKLIERKPSLVIQMRDYNNFEYVIKQGDNFSDLKDAYVHLSKNPQAVSEGINSYVLPALNAQQPSAFVG